MRNNFITKPRDNKIHTVAEFSQDGIKLVQHLKGENIFKTIYIALGIGSPEQELITAFKKAVKNNRINMKNLWVSLDRSLVAMRLAKLPSAKKEEISQMVSWQAIKILPNSPQDIVFSYRVIGAAGADLSYVALVVAPRNTVNKIINICDTLKLTPKVIALSSEGLLYWARHQRINTLQPVLILDIGKNSAELAVIHMDELIFSRSFSLGQSQDDDFIGKKIIGELKLFIEFYRRQKVAPDVSRIILSGDSNYAHKFLSIIETGVNLPVEAPRCPADRRIINLTSQEDASKTSFISISGLAISGAIPEINLIPQDYQDKKLNLKKKREAFKTLVLFAYAFLLSLGIIGFNFYCKVKVARDIDSQLSRIRRLVNDAQRIRNEAAVVNAQINNRGLCLDVLREIHRLMPKDMQLDNFVFEDLGMAILKGKALDMSSVFNLALILNDSPIFDSAQVKYVTQKKIQMGEVTDFEISCRLNLDKNK